MSFPLFGMGYKYQGRKNEEFYHGRCEKCEKYVQLESYETRLYLFIFIIPIPLDKERVLDYCPNCGHHKTMLLSQWHEVEHDILQAKRIDFGKIAPDEAQDALERHQNLALYGGEGNLVTLAAEMKARFSDSVTVQLYLGDFYLEQEEDEAAHECFEAALRADPDNPEAKRALIVSAIRRGDLSRARSMLSELSPTDGDEGLKLRRMLASAYQESGDHAKAFYIYQQIAWDNPDIMGTDGRLRKQVKKSEKALGYAETILPKSKKKPLPLDLIALVVVILLLALIVYLLIDKN